MKKTRTKMFLLMTMALMMSMFFGMTAQAKSYKKLYKEFLEKHTSYQYFCVYNLDAAGNPELIAMDGFPGAFYYYDVYTVSGNKVKKVGEHVSRVMNTSSGTPAIKVIPKYHALYKYSWTNGNGGMHVQLVKMANKKLKLFCNFYDYYDAPSRVYQFAKGTAALKTVSKAKYDSYAKKYVGTYSSKTGLYSRMKSIAMAANTSANRSAKLG